MFKEINDKKRRYEKNMIIGYFIIGVAFVSYLPLAATLGVMAFFIVGLPFIGGGIYVRRNLLKIKNLSNQFKEKYVSKELVKVFPNSNYQYLEGFTEEEVIDSLLLHHRDRFKSEDMIQGVYEDVRFRCSDVEQKEVRRSGKHTRVVTVFQGRFYEFDFPKSFKHDLLLLQPHHFRPFSGLKRVKTESIDFNSELKIYAQNEHEAFYILTPDFMEKLMYFDRKYKDKIDFSFKDSRLFIAIDTRRDYFDIKAFKDLNESIFNEYKEELVDIKDLLVTLNLDTKLFKSS